MAIIKTDDFAWHSATKGKCIALQRPKAPDETFVFRLASQEEVDMYELPGAIEISESAAKEMAYQMGWHSPEAIERWRTMHDIEMHKRDVQIEELETAVEFYDPENPTIRQLARELDLMEALRDDAIKQFHEAEARIKELESE